MTWVDCINESHFFTHSKQTLVFFKGCRWHLACILARDPGGGPETAFLAGRLLEKAVAHDATKARPLHPVALNALSQMRVKRPNVGGDMSYPESDRFGAEGGSVPAEDVFDTMEDWLGTSGGAGTAGGSSDSAGGSSRGPHRRRQV